MFSDNNYSFKLGVADWVSGNPGKTSSEIIVTVKTIPGGIGFLSIFNLK